jgi:hypothetical protein
MKKRSPYGYWQNKKNVINDAKKYDNRTEWKTKSPAAYVSAKKNGWMNECRKVIKSQRKVEVGYWQNKKNVIEDAKLCKTSSEWIRKANGAYQSAQKNGWLGICSKHMVKISGKWQVKVNVLEDAKKYNTRSDWNKKSNAAYQSARRNGWLEICCKHMVNKMGKWQIKMNVINDSKRYETRHEWIKNSNPAYLSASRNGWLDECYATTGAVISRATL